MSITSWVILICAIAFIGVTVFWASAKAEPYQFDSSLEIPEDALFDYERCYFKSFNGSLILDCMAFFNFEKSEEWIREQEEKFIEDLLDETEDEESQHDVSESRPAKTPTQKLIDRLEEDIKKGSSSTADKELLKLLKTLNDKCYFGIEEGYPIQKFAQHLLPDYDPRAGLYNKALDLGNYPELKKILQLIEACEAWTDYKQKNLRQYLDIEVDSFLPIDKTTHAHTAEGITPIPSHKLPDDAKEINDYNAKRVICVNDYYGQAYKKQQGCVIDYGSEIRDFSDPRELTELQKEAHRRAGDICDPQYNFPMSYKLDMGCQLIVSDDYDYQKSSNVSITENPVFQDWFHYNQDPVNNDSQQLKKAQQKNLQKYMERQR